MDIFLSRVTQQAMNYAIRSGITITATYAFKQSSRLLKTVEGNEKVELTKLQERLESKIRIISPAIDMIDLISARGNTSLESAVSLTRSLRWDIQALGQRIAQAANEEEERSRGTVQKGSSKASKELELKQIIDDTRRVLDRIEDAVPLINLAITTSGANLSTSMPSTISPSRLLQASTFLTAGDTQYSSLQSQPVQIGPTFTLSLYMLFQGHLRPQNEEQIRNTTWQEVVHKARLMLLRVPLEKLYDQPDSGGSETLGAEAQNSTEQHFPAEVRSEEFAYKVVVVEDLDDDRVHTLEEGAQPNSCLGVDQAGIKEVIPVHEISKIFYADTGKILNIGSEGEINNPILLLKRDINAVPPRRMMQRLDEFEDQIVESIEQPSSSPPQVQQVKGNGSHSQIDAQVDKEHLSSSIGAEGAEPGNQWRIPSNIDPEWLAFEVYTESEESDTESEVVETVSSKPPNSRAHSLDPGITNALSQLQIRGSSSPSPNTAESQQLIPTPSQQATPAIRTSLSLLETLLRLLSLQQFQQTSHLSIPDELLNFFLSEASTTGAASGDDASRRRLRYEARQHVGFDPYDESPIKRRGEDYQYRGGTSQSGDVWNESNGNWSDEQLHEGWMKEREYTSPHDEGYGTYQLSDPQRGPIERGSQSPQLLLNARRDSSRNSTPDRELPPFPRSASSSDARRLHLSSSSPRTPPSMQTRFKSIQQAARRGSPLAKPTTGTTDGAELTLAEKRDKGG